jgi:uncharacterized protein YndB with AHSA1/START domain
MRQSHLIHFSIARPVDDVYAFLVDPKNYPRWAAVEGGMAQLRANEWLTRTAFGDRIVRFTEPNAYGVLDHAVYAKGEEPLVMPMRVVANGDGTELMFLFIRRDDMSDEQFKSTIEWVTTDLLTLRSLLETPTIR